MELIQVRGRVIILYWGYTYAKKAGKKNRIRLFRQTKTI